MKLERYENYKDSGIEWIGEIPAHWDLKRIKDIFILERGKFTHRPRNDPRLYDGNYPFIQTSEVSQANMYIRNYQQTLNEDGVKVSKEFKKDTILMTIAANIGDVAILEFNAYLPDSIVGFLTKENHLYLYYLLKATQKELNSIKITNTQDNLNLERLNGIVKILPPPEEQTTIANFLNQKTAHIDKKIELLEQKITKYEELKKTLINETVCRGLDKSVELKDSGVEWIGKIPKHWEVKRLKDVFYESKKRSSTGVEDLLSVSEYTGINKRSKMVNEGDHLSRADSLVDYKICNISDLVVNIMLAWKRGLGIFPYFGIVSPAYCVYSPIIEINSHYFHYLLRTDAAINKFKRYSTGIMESRLRLYPTSFFSIATVFPPVEEQSAIAVFLSKKCNKIDFIIQTIKQETELLKEFRKTLINDVVTGKIKVPDA